MTAVDDVFAGLDDLPWPDLHHAYGPAAEVPDLLRGLVDPDPATRESALDAMYGGVHHQGDVYDSTVTALPFLLRIAAAPGLPGRPEVIKLIASIGGADIEPDLLPPPDLDADASAIGQLYTDANAVVADHHDLWIGLLSDPDPKVRRASAEVLPACRALTAASITSLLAAAADEPDLDARTSHIGVLGTLACRGGSSAAVVAWLTGIIDGQGSVRDRIAALSQLVRLDADVPVRIAIDLIPRLYQEGTGTPEPAGFETDTLIGSIRVLRELANEGRRSPDANQIVFDVAASFAHRPDDGQQLVTSMLRSPDWECRFDAIVPAIRLIARWRGDYPEIVALTCDQLTDPHTALPPRALMLLHDIGPLAAPAADALAACIEASPREADSATPACQSSALVRWPNGTASTGDVCVTLAAIGDRRVLPILAWLLDRDDMPDDVPHLIAGFGTAAADLIPSLWHRLRRLPVTDDRCIGVIRALHAAGAPTADVVRALLARPASIFVATNLGQLGPAAAGATEHLRRWTRSDDSRLAAAAAIALARIGGPAEPVLAFVTGRAANEYVRHSALTAAAALGPAGRPALDLARSALTESDPTWWTPFHGAEAIWRITAETDAVLPVLRQAWLGNVYTRCDLAKLWIDMGPAAADVRDLLDAEIGSRRRHNVNEDSWSSGKVATDLELLDLCRTALAAIG